MKTLNMYGPFELATEVVDSMVKKGRIGNYAFGTVKNDRTFIVKYVGRSDNDLNAEIKQQMNSKYSHFKFSYAEDVTEAYNKECDNFHDFGEEKKLDNQIHPASPKGMNLVCNRCFMKERGLI